MDGTQQKVEGGTGTGTGTAAAAAETLLPVPAQRGTGASERQSLWRRIALRRDARRNRVASLDGEAVLARLDAMEERLAGLERAIDQRFSQLEHRFLQLWEIEENLGRLGDLPDKVEGLVRGSESLERSIRAIRRRLTWQISLFVAGLAALSAIAVLLGRL